MKIDEYVSLGHRYFDLGSLDRKMLRRLVQILSGIGYTKANLTKALRISHLNMISLAAIPLYLDFRLNEPTPFNMAAQLFIFSQKFSREDLLKHLFTDEEIEAFCAMKILLEKEGLISSAVDIYPVLGTYIATDHHFTETRSSRAVMFLGDDSYTLAKGTFRHRVGRALDLCTGSGIHAFAAARHAREVVGVDISPRAINFAQFNAIFNGIENVTFLQGDLYEPVRGERFDLITANPPFVPVPAEDATLYYRNGGTSGEEILVRILRGLDAHLTEKGMCQIITEACFREGHDYIQDLYGMLDRRDFDILMFAGGHVPMEVFVMGHLKNTPTFIQYRERMTHWLQNYYARGIKEVAEALITIARSHNPSPSSILLDYKIPTGSFWEKVASHLEQMRRASNDRSFPKQVATLGSNVKCLWKNDLRGGDPAGFAEFREEGLRERQSLTMEELQLLELCDGKRKIREIAHAWANGDVKGRSAKKSHALSLLRKLTEKQVIDLGDPGSSTPPVFALIPPCIIIDMLPTICEWVQDLV